ncbi:MAG TPA: universal stress protein [Candidatus Dormibacteraeota bacterium]|nr:universal stress protein [Candidatus Dormibacteraeota bacterium]
MFKQIVVGVDGRAGGRDAVALAKLLVAAGGELTLAHVVSGNAHAYRGASAAYEAPEAERAEALLETVRTETGVEAHLRWRGSSSVGRGLHELCELVGADLVAVGSSRRGLLGRVLIADDTSAALNGAPCSIAIAPTDYSQQHGAMREIGIGYDGSPESDHALSVARMVADASGAKLSALEAVSLPSDAFLGPGAVDNTPGRLLEDARGRIAALGDVAPHAAYGQPAEELALYSASLDLLIVGSRGYGPIGRLIHGSTSQQLAHSARCPLLVLTRTARPTSTDEAAGHRREGKVPLKG